jgi:hypothetical protein
VTIFDFAPPGVSRSWAEHRAGLQRELFAKLKVNRYVPRQDVTLKLLGDDAAVTTFTFDYANEGKDGSRATVVGRQTNVWERRGGKWLIVTSTGRRCPRTPVSGSSSPARTSRRVAACGSGTWKGSSGQWATT